MCSGGEHGRVPAQRLADQDRPPQRQLINNGDDVAHEVALDDRVSDRRSAQSRRNFPSHRRLADAGAPSDKQYLRLIYGGSVPNRDRLTRSDIALCLP